MMQVLADSFTADLADDLRQAVIDAVDGIGVHLEAIEDEVDVLAADAARTEPGESIPWEEARARLG